MTPNFELIDDALGRLILRRPGLPDVENVQLRRAFPWSAADRLISLRDADGKELLLIERLEDLNAVLRKRIEAWLAANSFVPRILHVESVDVSFGYQEWRVQTDRGPAEFRVLEREDLRFLDDGRFRLKDGDGNVYELPALENLDKASRRAVEAML